MEKQTGPQVVISEPLEDFFELPLVPEILPEKGKRKKKSSPRRPYDHGGWVDSQFAYTVEQREAILAALPVNPDGEATTAALEERVREYLSECEHRKDEPTPSEITAQMQELEACLENLQRCVWGLHGPTIDAIDLPVVNYFLKRTGKASEENIYSLREKLQPILRLLLHQIWIAQRTHRTKRGAPKEEELAVFLDRLCSLWESCGNRLTKRAFDTRYHSRLRKFLDAVLEPIPELDTYTETLKTVLKRKHAARSLASPGTHGGN